MQPSQSLNSGSIYLFNGSFHSNVGSLFCVPIQQETAEKRNALTEKGTTVSFSIHLLEVQTCRIALTAQFIK